MKRTTKEWRNKYGPSVKREHHLVPQALLKDKNFIRQMKKLGIDDVKRYIDRKIAILPNGNHIYIHSEKWNDKWKKWLGDNPNFTLEDIEKNIKKLMKDFNIPKSSRDAKIYGKN